MKRQDNVRGEGDKEKWCARFLQRVKNAKSEILIRLSGRKGDLGSNNNGGNDWKAGWGCSWDNLYLGGSWWEHVPGCVEQGDGASLWCLNRLLVLFCQLSVVLSANHVTPESWSENPNFTTLKTQSQICFQWTLLFLENLHCQNKLNNTKQTQKLPAQLVILY